VRAVTRDGTAKKASDYQHTARWLRFWWPFRRRKFKVPVLGDLEPERTEYFRVELKNPRRTLIADRWGRGTIIDEDHNPPVAADDQATTDEDTPVVIIVLANDIDRDDNIDPSTLAITAAPSHGTASVTAEHKILYTPATNYFGSDQFQYRICDQDQLCDTATVQVTVTAVNDPPTASDDGPYATLRDTDLTVEAPGVLHNDSDPEGDELQAVIDQTPMHGYVGLNSDGSFNYHPGSGYVGTDQFRYVAYDGDEYSEPATVTVEVVDMQLYSVTFEGSYQVARDPGSSGPPYDTPQWLDANLDGDADDADDHRWPAAYVRSRPGEQNRPQLSAEFHLSGNWHGGEILVRADGPADLDIAPTIATVSGDRVTISDVQTSGAFPDTVYHYDDFQLDWEASSDGGNTWIYVGSSSNDIYLTWDTPQTDLFHTVIHIGSHNAHGIGGAEPGPVVEAAWQEFADLEVQRLYDGMVMKYNHDRDTALEAPDMLAHPQGKGQCTAWADLWIRVLAAQGIEAEPRDMRPQAPYSAFRVRLMPAQGSGGANYTNTDFGFHRVVAVDVFPDTIFDPSYGTRTERTDNRSVELIYEDENVTHFGIDVDSDGYIDSWLEDQKGVQELQWSQ